MRKSLSILLALLAVFAFAGVALAQPEGEVAAEAAKTLSSTSGYVLIALILGMTITAVGCGLAQSRGLVAAVDGTARNPEAGGRLMVTLILGLAFIESMAIYALVVNLLVMNSI